MAASDCSFCGKHGEPCVLRKGTAAICGPCASTFASRTPDEQATRARFERELVLARDSAAGVTPRARFERELARARKRAAQRAWEGTGVVIRRPSEDRSEVIRRQMSEDRGEAIQRRMSEVRGVVIRRRAPDCSTRMPWPSSDVAAEGDCSFCGEHETYPIVGTERFRGQTEDVTVTGKPVRICSSCVERAAAAVRPS